MKVTIKQLLVAQKHLSFFISKGPWINDEVNSYTEQYTKGNRYAITC